LQFKDLATQAEMQHKLLHGHIAPHRARGYEFALCCVWNLTKLLAFIVRNGSAEGSVHGSYSDEGHERAVAAAAARDEGRELRKMYECELARPLPNKFAALLSALDADRSHESHGPAK